MCRKLSILLVLVLVLGQLWGCSPAPSGTETTAQTQTPPASTQDTDPVQPTTPVPEDSPYLQYYNPEWEHILTHSPEDVVQRSDLLGLDANELRLARNEIYARHGYYFSDGELLAYFNLCSWYQPDLSKTSADSLPLTEQERQAISVIVEYENNPGYDPSGLDTQLDYPVEFRAFSLHLPAYWKDTCTVDQSENWLSFSQTANYDLYGGHLFSISLHETKEEVEYFPAYEIIGTVTHENGTQYYVVVTEPTDVQFDFGDFSMGQYRYMYREMGRILATIEGINGYTYTPL